MNEEILKATGIIVGGVLAAVAPYVVTWVKKKFNKPVDEAKDFLHNTEHRALINEVLVEIRTLLGANRVALVEYHNGNAAINGLPFNYASMTYEKADVTTREMMLDYQKVPISPVCETLLELHNSEGGFVRVGKDYPRPAVVDINRYHGIETSYMFRIGDHIKYGTVYAMWIHEDIKLTEEELDLIHLKTLYIKDIMCKMKKH